MSFDNNATLYNRVKNKKYTNNDVITNNIVPTA